MISHGDELGRTQLGNNNGYCQDNEISWVHWDLDEDEQRLLAFTQSIIRLRRSTRSSGVAVLRRQSRPRRRERAR